MRSLSVIVPAYRAAGTLVDCLSSIKADLPTGAELILVDDGSPDATAAIAEKYCDQVIRLRENAGDATARLAGIHSATGEILLFIDSDVVIPPGTCAKVIAALAADPGLAAVTGRLSAAPSPGFFSDYKNLYMNFIFGRLPDEVTFLYGSIFALRASEIRSVNLPAVRGGADTAFGQYLSQEGKRIRILRDLEVVHLKRYTLHSFYRNDFFVPYSWAPLFRRFHGWRQLGRRGTGFAHSSKGQLLSLLAAWSTVVLAFLASLGYCSFIGPFAMFAIWSALNTRFLTFIFLRRGAWYGLRSIPVTFVDHLVMALGAGCGLVKAYMKDKP